MNANKRLCARAEKRAALGERAMALLRDQTPEAIIMRRTIADGDEYGPGECSREARARTELGAELREARAIATLTVTADGRPVDELQFVDADIARAFSGAIYLTGTPTQVHLARELRRLREESFFVREATVCCPTCAMLTRTGDIRPCPGCGGESPWVLAMRAIITPPPQEQRAWQDPDNPPPDDAEGSR